MRNAAIIALCAITLVSCYGGPAGEVVGVYPREDWVQVNPYGMNYIHYGMSAAEAVVAPRFSTKHHEDTFDPNPDRTLAFLEAASLELDNREDIATRAEALSALGHKVTVTPKPKNIANPVMITIDPKTGRLQAAGDPLAQRHAAALP